MSPNRITKQEAAALMGRSVRTVERRGLGEGGKVGVETLPVEAQRGFLARGKVVELAPITDVGQMTLALTAPVGPNLSLADRKEAERRYSAIEPLLQPDRCPLLYAQHGSKGVVVAWLCGQYEVKRATLYLWLAKYKLGGLPALVTKDRADKGISRSLNRAAMELLVGLSLPQKGSRGTYSVAEMLRNYEDERTWRAANAARRLTDWECKKYGPYVNEDGKLRPEVQLPEVSRETFRRWFERIPEFIRELGRNGEEAFHNTQAIISYRDISAISPLDYVVMDHRRLDMFCLAPAPGGWKLVRPWLTAAIDMRTRKWLAWVIVEAPSSDSIAAVLRKAFVAHGLPKSLYWDNGKDFTCEWFEGKQVARGERRLEKLDGVWRGVLGQLDLQVHHAIPYNARAKIIEPNFKRIANFDRTLPEWCGHKPGARPERFEALVAQHEAWVAGQAEGTPFRTIGQVAALYEDAIEDLNEREMEGALGMRKVKCGGGYAWMSPNECWDVMIPKVARRTVPADVLQMVFAKQRTLTVQHAEVCVTLNGEQFHYRCDGLARLNGKKVDLRYDPLDLEMAALYYEDRFAGMVHCAALRRMGEDQFKEDEQERRRLLRQTKLFIKAAHQLVPVTDPEARLNRRRAVAPVRDVPRVEAPAELPAALLEAGAARRADLDLRFQDLPEVEVTVEAVAAPVEDDEFDFFS